MSLDDIIANTNKEISGSRTKNRLTVQISYAIQLIMEFYTTDFLVMMVSHTRFAGVPRVV